jgi:hypothetical protein
VGIYKDDGDSWIKIKNRAYSQAEGRHEFDESPLASECRAVWGECAIGPLIFFDSCHQVLTALWERVYGKPKQDLSVTGGVIHAHVRDPLLAFGVR